MKPDWCRCSYYFMFVTSMPKVTKNQKWDERNNTGNLTSKSEAIKLQKNIAQSYVTFWDWNTSFEFEIPLKQNCFINALYECWVNQGLSVVNGKKWDIGCKISARKKKCWNCKKKILVSCTFLLTIPKFLVQKAIIKMGKNLAGRWRTVRFSRGSWLIS